LTTFLLSLGVIGVAMLAMAIGVILSGRCLRGSCGGPDVTGPDGQSLRCASCPRNDEAQSEGVPMEASQ
jgi:hypothetical protein